MTQANLLKKIRMYFSNKPEIAAAYLYGSYARGEQKEDSDIDIAVLFTKNKMFNYFSKCVDMGGNLKKITNKKVEIQELNHSGIEFAKRVLDEGILIVENDPIQRIDFTVDKINTYFDMQPFYDEYYYYLSQRALKGDFNARY